MKVWIVAHFVLFPNEPGVNRFHYLAELLAKFGHDVTLFTSKFSHKWKKHRSFSEITKEVNYKIVLIDEPEYLDNLSFKRLKAHRLFGKNLYTTLKDNDDTPSIILVSFPSISCTSAVAKFANKKQIPYVIDIQDWWPDAFEIAFDSEFMRKVFRLSIKPIKLYLKRIFSDAAALIAVSESYLKNAVSISNNPKNQLKEVIPLGVDLEKFDYLKSKYTKTKDDKFKLVYIGQVGPNYDLQTVVKAVPVLRRKIPNLEVDIVGDGDTLGTLKDLTKQQNCSDIIKFPGFVTYDKVIKYLVDADVALNTIKQEWIFLPNKVFDYCAAGLPIVNSIKADFGCYVKKYKMGINYTPTNVSEFSNAVENLWKNQSLRKEFGKNSRKFAEEFGDRKKNYFKLVEILEKLSKNK